MWCTPRECSWSFTGYVITLMTFINRLTNYLFICLQMTQQYIIPIIMQGNINTELKSVALWLNANKLSFILFHPPQKKHSKISLIINKLPIPEKTSTKYHSYNLGQSRYLVGTHKIHKYENS